MGSDPLAEINALIASCDPTEIKATTKTVHKYTTYVLPEGQEYHYTCPECGNDFVDTKRMRVVCDNCIEGWRQIYVTRRLPGRDKY